MRSVQLVSRPPGRSERGITQRLLRGMQPAFPEPLLFLCGSGAEAGAHGVCCSSQSDSQLRAPRRIYGREAFKTLRDSQPVAGLTGQRETLEVGFERRACIFLAEDVIRE